MGEVALASSRVIHDLQRLLSLEAAASLADMCRQKGGSRVYRGCIWTHSLWRLLGSACHSEVGAV